MILRVILVTSAAQRLFIVYDIPLSSYDYVSVVSLAIGCVSGIILACAGKLATVLTICIAYVAFSAWVSTSWPIILGVGLGLGILSYGILHYFSKLFPLVAHIGASLALSVVIVANMAWFASDDSPKTWGHIFDNSTEWGIFIGISGLRLIVIAYLYWVKADAVASRDDAERSAGFQLVRD